MEEKESNFTIAIEIICRQFWTMDEFSVYKFHAFNAEENLWISNIDSILSKSMYLTDPENGWIEFEGQTYELISVSMITDIERGKLVLKDIKTRALSIYYTPLPSSLENHNYL